MGRLGFFDISILAGAGGGIAFYLFPFWIAIFAVMAWVWIFMELWDKPKV